MSSRTVIRLAAYALLWWVVPATASGQPGQVFGTFPWQLQPYCNVVTLTLTNTAAGLTLDGVDDQCGATNKASAVGMATFDGAGNVTLGFTVVTAPSGKPVHVSALVSPANGQGTWTDSVGNSGTFAFFGATPGLPARPLPASGVAPSSITTTEIAAAAVGASDINTAEVQARVSGTCAAGRVMTGVNANGTVTCVNGQPQVQFRAEGQLPIALPANTRTDIRWSAVVFNEGGGTYDATTGIYTVPVTGLYQVTTTGATSVYSTPAVGSSRFITLHVNSAIVQQGADEAADTLQNLTLVCMRKLTAGDRVKVSMSHDLGVGVFTFGPDASFTHMSIVQLR